MKYKILLFILLGLFLISFTSAEGEWINANFSSSPCNEPTAIESNGTFIWVADYNYDGVCRYYMNGTYMNQWTFTTGHNNPYDLASDGTYLWNVDVTDSRVYKYYINGTYVNYFATSGANSWGLDYYDNYLYLIRLGILYKLFTNGTATGSSVDLSSEGIGVGYGITNNGTYFWILDNSDKNVHKYFINMTYTGSYFNISEVSNPYSITNNGTHFFVLSYDTDKWTMYDMGITGEEPSIKVTSISDNSSSSQPRQNQSITHNSYWQTNASLSTYIFSWNNSGSFVNSTPVLFSGSANWSNVTMNVTNVSGTNIGWIIYANDSENKWNNTGIQEYLIKSTSEIYPYEYHTTVDNQVWFRAGEEWAQTFTIGTVGTNESHNITNITLQLYKLNSPGTCNISILSTNSSGFPSFPVLTSVTFNGNDLSTSATNYTFNFSTPAELSAGKTYAIGFFCPSGDVNNRVAIRLDATSPSYTGGSMYSTANAGTTWGGSNNYDAFFIEYGENTSVPSGEPAVITPRINYSINDDNVLHNYGNNLNAQTFNNTNETFTLTSIKLKLYKAGTPGTMNLYLTAVNGTGYPTGSPLSSGSVNAEDFTTSTSGEWYEINMSSYNLQYYTKYALWFNCTTCSGSSDDINWRTDASSPAYTLGQGYYTTDGGATWLDYSAVDNLFEIYGTKLEPITSIYPKSEGQNSSATYPKFYDVILHYVEWVTNATSLSTYIFSWNNSGSWENLSTTLFGANNWSNVTTNITAVKDSNIGWWVWVNDSENKVNSTTIFEYLVRNTNPTSSGGMFNETGIIFNGTPIKVNVSIGDLDGLDDIDIVIATIQKNISSGVGTGNTTPLNMTYYPYQILPPSGWTGAISAVEVSPLYENGVIDMWYRNYPPNHIVYSNSTNGINFTNPINCTFDGSINLQQLEYVIGPYNVTGYTNNSYFMFMPNFVNDTEAGADIRVYTSTNKINWTSACGGGEITTGGYKKNPAVWYNSSDGVWHGLFEQGSGTFTTYYWNSTNLCSGWTKYSQQFGSNAGNADIHYSEQNNSFVVFYGDMTDGTSNVKTSVAVGTNLNQLSVFHRNLLTPAGAGFGGTFASDPGIVVIDDGNASFYSPWLAYFAVVPSGDDARGALAYDSQNRTFDESFFGKTIGYNENLTLSQVGSTSEWSGTFTNTSYVGLYNLTKIYVNDTDNAWNTSSYSTVSFETQEEEGIDTSSCSVYFNATSPINYPATFIAYTNCTSAFTLRRNGTTITNGTTISGVGAYNISVQRTDTANYSNTYDDEQFIILAPPTINVILPPYDNYIYWLNYTENYYDWRPWYNYDIKWVSYGDNLDTCWFENITNFGGVRTNTTIACNENATLVNIPINTNVDLRFYANDTSGNIFGLTRNDIRNQIRIDNDGFTYLNTSLIYNNETFSLKVNSGDRGNLSEVNFVLNNIKYSQTPVLVGSGFNVTDNIFINESVVGTYQYYWEFDFGEGFFNSTIYNLTIGTSPVITINSPTNSTYYLTSASPNVTINFSVADDNFVNATYNVNGTNMTSLSNETQINLNLSTGIYNLYVWAIDGNGFIDYETLVFSVKNLNQLTPTYTSSIYETQGTSYIVNLTDLYNTNLSAVTLFVNGSSYTPTQSGYLWNYTRQSPANYLNNVSLIWQLTYSGVNYNTTTYYQLINPINFGLCNATYTVPYLNLSFKDEATNISINGTIQSSTFVYYLGNGTANKTIYYSTSSNYTDYRFCFLPGNLTYYIYPSVSYNLGTDYPLRTWNPATKSYTNSTTNQTLYLLSTSTGSYVTFQVVNSADQPLSNVNVNATRLIDGISTVVAQGTTDSAGSIQFWLNPDYLHTFMFSKSGYTTFTTSLFPTEAEYTITLGGSSSSSGGTTTDYTRGIKLFVYPKSKELQNDTTYRFIFNMTSSYWDVDEYGFSLRLSNGTIIGTDTEVTEESGTSISYNVNNQSIIYMDYYYDIDGNYINNTVRWVVTNSLNTDWSIKTLVEDANTYMDSGLFGLDNFGRYIISFLLLFLVVGIVGYKYGVVSPFFMSVLTFAVVFFLDVITGILPTVRGIEHLLTYVAGLIALLVVVWDLTR